MKKSFALVPALAVVGQCFALPYAPAMEDVPDFNHEGLNVNILPDHKSKTLYVSPRNNAESVGDFVFEGSGVAVSCDDLLNLRRAYQRMPSDGDITKVLENYSFYSPQFEMTTGVAARKSDLLDTIAQAEKEHAMKLKVLVEDSSGKQVTIGTLFKDYVAKELKYNAYKEREKKLQRSRERLREVLLEDFLSAESVEEKRQLKRQYKEDLTQLVKEQNKFKFEFLYPAEDAYLEAYGRFLPYEKALDRLEELRTSLASIFRELQEVAQESVKRNEKLDSDWSSTPIGVAKASYGIFTDEVSTVKSFIAKRLAEIKENMLFAPSDEAYALEREYENLKAYKVVQLPIFDVRLNSSIQKRVIGASLEGTPKHSVSNFEYTTVSIPEKAMRSYARAMGSREETQMVSTGFDNHDDNEQPDSTDRGLLDTNDARLRTSKNAHMMVMTHFGDSFAASGIIKIPVTQGAYCSAGEPRLISKTYTYKTEENTVKKSRATYTEYPVMVEPSRRNLMPESVALRYKYFEKSEPFEATCKLSLDKSDNYFRNSGSITKRSWFWKSTRSWDNTKREIDNNLGLKCKFANRPSDEDPASRAQRDSKEQELMSQVFNMYLINFAKSWDVIRPNTDQVDIPDNPGGSPLKTAASSIMGVCGDMKGCQVANVVLKSVGEMYGEKRQGSTSSQERIRGEISRSFEEDGFITREGYSIINLRVNAH